MRGKSLFVQADLVEDELHEAMFEFSRFVSNQLVFDYNPNLVIEKYPALTLGTLVGHASEGYARGYWISFWDRLCLDRHTSFENDLRREFPRIVRHFDLMEFRRLQMVEQVTLQAGIPAYCLNDVVDLIELLIRGERWVSARDLINLLRSTAGASYLNRLDMPVHNFVRHGGEAATRIFEGIVKSIGDFANDPSGWVEQLDAGVLTHESADLPRLIFQGLVATLQTRNPHQFATRRTIRGVRHHEPILLLNLHEDAIELQVPATDHKWLVEMDDKKNEVDVDDYFGGTGTTVVVDHPVCHVVAQQHSGSTRFELDDGRNRLLVFTKDGRFVPRKTDVPSGLVYVVYPRECRLIDGASGKHIAPNLDLGSPRGWVGWRLLTISTSHVLSLQLTLEDARIGDPRTVRNSRDPEFVCLGELTGARTPGGDPVYTERPIVSIPPQPGGSRVDWIIRTRRAGEETWRNIVDVPVTDRIVEVSPLDGLDSSALGAFEISIRGPLQTNLWQSAFVAEGLDLYCEPALRAPTGDGLTEAAVSIQALSPLSVDRNDLKFEAQDRSKLVELRCGDVSERVLVEPPAIEVCARPAGTTSEWQARPLRFSPDSFSKADVLAVRVPSPGCSVVLVLESNSGEHAQRIEPSLKERSSSFEVPVVRLRDTVQRLRTGRLVADVTLSNGFATRAVIALFGPEKLYQRITVKKDVMYVEGRSRATGLSAHIWLETAPWMHGRSVAIAGDRVTLPPDLVRAGPLLVDVVVDDPWAPGSVPLTPNDSAQRIDAPGFAVGTDKHRNELARMLSGYVRGDLSGVSLADAWTVLAVARRPPASLQKELKNLILQQPAQAVASLPLSMAPQSEWARLLVESKLAAAKFGLTAVSEVGNQDPWVRAFVAVSALATGVDGFPRAELLKEVRTFGGSAVFEVLRSGLPGPDMAGSERSSELMGAHLAWKASPSRTVLADAAMRIERDLANRDKRLIPVLRSRSTQSDHRYDNLTAASLGMAVAARIASRGQLEERLTGDVYGAWVALARSAPRLVLRDLVLAEACLVHLELGNVAGGFDV